MKFDLKEKVIISDFEEIYKLNKEFEELNNKFDEKQHTSMTEEVQRTISTSIKEIVKYDIETVFNTFLELAAKDINGNLDKDDLVEGHYYWSKHGQKQLLCLTDLVKNELVCIQWFTKDHKFTRKVMFYPRGKNKTKVKLVDAAKGMQAVWGFTSSYKKAIYQKDIKTTFKIQILQICLKLEKDEIKKQKLEAKLEKVRKKKK